MNLRKWLLTHRLSKEIRTPSWATFVWNIIVLQVKRLECLIENLISYFPTKTDLSHDTIFPTMKYVRPAKAQTLLVAWMFFDC